MPLTIEDVVPADYEDAWTVNEANVPNVSSVSPEKLAHLHAQSCYMRKAVVDGELAGLLLALDEMADYDSPNYLWFRSRYERFVYIDRVMVADGYRRLGIGFKLYADLELQTRASATALMCEVNIEPPNPGSLAFHQSIGFREVGQQDAKGIRVSLLRKSLQMSGL